MQFLNPPHYVTQGLDSPMHLQYCYDSSFTAGIIDSAVRLYPQRSFIIQDDFMKSGTASGAIGDMGWTLSGTGTASIIAGEQNHPGIVRLSTPATTNAFVGIYIGDNTNFQIDYRTFYDFIITFRMNQTASVGFSAGLGNQSAGTLFPAHGVYVNKGTGGTVFTGRLGNAGSISTLTMPTQDTNWHSMRFRRGRNADKAYFSIDEGSETAITTNHPGANMNPFVVLTTTEAVVKTIDIDMISLALGVTR